MIFNGHVKRNCMTAPEYGSGLERVAGWNPAVVTNFIYNPNMAFGGSHQNKGALVELKSIGLGDKDRFVAELTALLAARLNISNTQYIAMALIDAPAAYTACAGNTFG